MNTALACIQKLSKGQLDSEIQKLEPTKILPYIVDKAFTPVGCDMDTLAAICLLVNVVVTAERNVYDNQLNDLEDRIDSLEDEKTCRILEEAV